MDSDGDGLFRVITLIAVLSCGVSLLAFPFSAKIGGISLVIFVFSVLSMFVVRVLTD